MIRFSFLFGRTGSRGVAAGSTTSMLAIWLAASICASFLALVSAANSSSLILRFRSRRMRLISLSGSLLMSSSCTAINLRSAFS